MYLLNSLCIHLVMAALALLHLQNPAAIFPLGLGLTVAVATLSYRYYEKRFLALKEKKFARRPNELRRTTQSLVPVVDTRPGSGA